MSDLIKYNKAQKLNNFSKPKFCPNCNKPMKPVLHSIIKKEGLFSNTQMAELHTDKCEWCGYKFEYWN